MDNIINFYGCFIMLWIIPTCINLCIYTALHITCKRITDNKCFIFIKVFNMSKTVIKKLNFRFLIPNFFRDKNIFKIFI